VKDVSSHLYLVHLASFFAQ